MPLGAEALYASASALKATRTASGTGSAEGRATVMPLGAEALCASASALKVDSSSIGGGGSAPPLLRGLWHERSTAVDRVGVALGITLFTRLQCGRQISLLSEARAGGALGAL